MSNISQHYDYIAVGHVTIDVLADGTRLAGGSALYGALQAARLGCRSLIYTAGRPDELRELLAPHLGELDLEVVEAPATTTLETSGSGPARSQRVLAWAGPIHVAAAPAARIVHLAPVARELPGTWPGQAGFTGLTAQGLVRRWSASDPAFTLGPPDEGALAHASRCDAIVISREEASVCRPLLERASGGGALVAITDGPRPSTLRLASGETLDIAVTALERPAEDLGAGDVYAAALFIELAGGSPPRAAGLFANMAAGLRMRGHGVAAVAGRAAIEQAIAHEQVG